MRWKYLFAAGALALAALLVPPTAAEPALYSQGLQRYFKAREILDQGVLAHGGAEALGGVATIRRDLLDDWVDVSQGPQPWTGVPDPGNLVPHAGFDDAVVISVLDYAGNGYFESRRVADSPAEYATIVDVVTAERGFQHISTYIPDAKAYYQDFAPGDLLGLLAQKVRRYPEGVLRMAMSRPETLQWVGDFEDSGRRYNVISFADPLGVRVLLYFDAATHLLARTETLRDHIVYGDTTSDTLYSDYRQVGALVLPFSQVDRVGGIPTRYIRATSITVGAPLPEEPMQPPANIVRIAETPSELTLEPLGDGLYLIRGPYNVMFAEFRDFLLVIEAPANSRYAEECLAIIRSAVPNKPIRLVTTHFHSDHIAGVRTYIAEGIPILTTSDAKPVIERAAVSRHTMRPDALSRNLKEPAIEIIDGSRTFSDSNQRVEIYDFGPAPHITHILVAYFPKKKLLHVADLFDVLTPELIIAGVDVVPMAKKIEELGLNVDLIVPMHGEPVTMEQFRAGLALRARYVEGKQE